MVFKINNVDVTPYIANEGLQWSRNDVDSPNAGRTMDATMYRDRVAIKYKWNVTCRPLLESELSTVLSLIEPEFFSVTFTDPVTQEVRTAEYYSNDVPAQYLMHINGKEYWSGVTFPVIEK